MLKGVPRVFFWYFHYLTNFIYLKLRIRRIIKRINPSLIHLFGTENAYFSSTILQLSKIKPVIISIQGYASHISSNSYFIRKRKKIEHQIIKCYKDFGTGDEPMKCFLKSINPKVIFHHHEFAINKPQYCSTDYSHKVYDIVFFARVSKDKGVEDLIKATSIIKKDKKGIKVCVIGPVSTNYLKYIKDLAIKLEVRTNIDFKGALNTLDDVHKIAVLSRVTVLPTYADAIPGTILESMLMKIPCVAYAVGGLPSLNHDCDAIILVKKGSINELAEKISEVLNGKLGKDKMIEDGYNMVNQRWDDKIIGNSIYSIYQKLLSAHEVKKV
jgi:glycosyltransferase involved in cell wall biosynthesis